MKTPFPRSTHLIATLLTLVLLAGIFSPPQAEGRNKIRQAFFNRYPSAVGTPLDVIDGSSHCLVCHYKAGGSGPKNPYGEGVASLLGLGEDAAIEGMENQDPEGDLFTTYLEIYAVGYSNTPTFPGLNATNVNNIEGMSPALVAPYVTPTTDVDNTPPEVTLTSPNGGETLTANEATTVTWTATDDNEVALIKLYESTDGGTTFKPLNLSLTNTGSYTWFPANRPTEFAVLKIIAVDSATNTNEDESDAVFTIISPPGGLVPTTLRDFDMPGTQPFEGGSEAESPENCAVCHGGYDDAVEPYRNWQGSMMALASLDPLFEANMAIANQDAPDSGDLCLRCHISNGWMQGRSVPTDGSAMLAHDKIGVSCDFCHRMVDPDYNVAFSPERDAQVLGDLSFPFPGGEAEYGNGMWVVDYGAIQRGPFSDVDAAHPTITSSFHQTSAFCGTCHDVSNPAFYKDEAGVYQPNSFDAANNDFSPNSMAPVERTYSEWKHSEYNSYDGVVAPEFAGNLWPPVVRSCQDCHMRDASGYGANPATNPTVPLRPDIPVHDMTGGSTWLPPLIAEMYASTYSFVNAEAIAAGVERATYMLENAAELSLEQSIGNLVVRVTNNTGHKLPTGYPEGRRVWLNVKFYDSGDNLVGESGAYDPDTGILTHDDEAKIYEVHPGIDSNIANPAAGLPEGPSLHFVLNNKIFEDNRIPPRGFTNAEFAEFGGAPIGHHYDDYQYWDDTPYVVPAGAVRAVVNLYYQSTSKEFIEFLRDENTTNDKGQIMYDLWNDNGKCPPTLMETAEYAVLEAAGDADEDGLSNIEEDAFGSDPHSAASAHRPVGHTAGGHTALTYTRSTSSQAQVIVEVSTDLSEWHDAAMGTEVIEHSVVENGNGTQTVEIRMGAALGPGEKQFIRLRVE
jgi:hypothetical protein